MTRLRVCTTAELPRSERLALRRLLDVAFDGDFTDDDWEHGLGGWHALVTVRGELVAHAAVVPRTVEVGDCCLRVGYVEAVATAPRHQRAGHGSRAMRAVAEGIAVRGLVPSTDPITCRARRGDDW